MQHEDWDGCSPVTITGYTHANVVGSDGEFISYNVHPCYHGAPWYDWAHVHYAVEQAEDDVEQQYYPSKILGFMKTSNGIEAIIHYSMEEVRILYRYHLFVILFVSYQIMAMSTKTTNI